MVKEVRTETERNNERDDERLGKEWERREKEIDVKGLRERKHESVCGIFYRAGNDSDNAGSNYVSTGE
jgi:hypothetical protein